MTPRKERLTVTVDPELVEAGNSAVAAGLADSLSAWVNAALAAKAAQDRKLRALAAAVADYESQFGEITDEEIASQRRADREAAVVIRGRSGDGSRASSRRSTKRPGQGAA
jgi:glycerol dehydrogenase-like iron-containing ADH family enzyme